MLIVTEKEIFEGIYKEKNPNKTALCFIRNIENLEEHIIDSTASRFIDIKQGSEFKKPEIDLEAKALLDDLKMKKIPSILAPSNIFKFNVKWENDGIERESLKAYLETFGELFHSKIVELIENAMRIEKEKDKLVHETYFKLGLIREQNFEGGGFNTPRQRFNSQSNQIIAEFKEFITELGSQANEYNNIISKFFGRDDIMIRVYFIRKISFILFLTKKN